MLGHLVSFEKRACQQRAFDEYTDGRGPEQAPTGYMERVLREYPDAALAFPVLPT